MDGDRNNVEDQHVDGIDSSFHFLTPLNPTKVTPEFLFDLWKKLMQSPLNADDVGVANPEFWVRRLYEVNSEHYTAPNAYVSVLNIIPKINADIHYAAYGPLEYGSIRETMSELCKHLFTKYSLNRLTGYIPAPNKEAQRVATLAGFKFEGAMRGMFLRDEVYHDLQVWGLTHADFLLRG